MRPGSTALAAVLLAPSLASSLWATRARADARADALFAEGRAAAQHGRYKEACDKFEEVLHRDGAAIGAMLNLGECHEKLHHLVVALDWYHQTRTQAARAHQREYEDAAGEREQAISPRVPTVVVELAEPAPAGMTVTIDGKPIDASAWPRSFVDPGPHHVEVRAPERPPIRDDFTIDEREHHTVHVKWQVAVAGAVDPGHARRVRAFEIAGGALALYAGFLAAGLYYRGEYEAQCPTEDTCRFPGGRAEANRIDERAKIWTTSLFAAGTLVAGIAVVVYLTAPQGGRVETSAVAPIIDRDGVGLAYSARF